MKKFIFVLIYLIIVSKGTWAQSNSADSIIINKSGEFSTFDGLIYDPQTMTYLHHIVDSLNLKIKVCEPRDFYSTYQGQGYYVIIHNPSQKVKEDLKNNIGFKEFMTKYPKAEATQSDLIYRTLYKSSSKRKTSTSYAAFGFSGWGGNDINLSLIDVPAKNGEWRYEENSYNKSISAFYFTTDMKTQLLDEKYARWAQYAECMIDTSNQVFFENAKYERFTEKKTNSKPQLRKFTDAVELDYTKIPKIADGKKQYSETEADSIESVLYSKWLKSEEAKIQKLTKSGELEKLLDAAIEEAKKDSIGDSLLEHYAEKFGRKEDVLFLKRCRIVVGQCSQDDSPRVHAQQIAILAAQTVSWEIFLRAHLDIMNDKFQRMSDGSYAWGERQTYIKELEVLGIDANQLLFGICLLVDNAAPNRYYGNISRLGRALSESQNRDLMEKEMLSAVEDENLDVLNRLLFYYLFKNYNHYIDDVVVKEKNAEELLKRAKTFPQDIKKELGIK